MEPKGNSVKCPSRDTMTPRYITLCGKLFVFLQYVIKQVLKMLKLQLVLYYNNGKYVRILYISLMFLNEFAN